MLFLTFFLIFYKDVSTNINFFQSKRHPSLVSVIVDIGIIGLIIVRVYQTDRTDGAPDPNMYHTLFAIQKVSRILIGCSLFGQTLQVIRFLSNLNFTRRPYVILIRSVKFLRNMPFMTFPVIAAFVCVEILMKKIQIRDGCRTELLGIYILSSATIGKTPFFIWAGLF